MVFLRLEVCVWTALCVCVCVFCWGFLFYEWLPAGRAGMPAGMLQLPYPGLIPPGGKERALGWWERWGCSGGSLERWGRVGNQVGFGWDFASAAAGFNVGQVSSPFFLAQKRAVAFQLGCCTCLRVSHLQRFSWQVVILVGLWSSGSGSGPSATGRMGPSCIAPFTPIVSRVNHRLGTPKGTHNPVTSLHPGSSFPGGGDGFLRYSSTERTPVQLGLCK